MVMMMPMAEVLIRLRLAPDEDSGRGGEAADAVADGAKPKRCHDANRAVHNQPDAEHDRETDQGDARIDQHDDAGQHAVRRGRSRVLS
jgi:hypothetical protein